MFTCDTGRSCPFVVFGTMAKRKIGPRAVKQLLTDGRSAVLKGFKSKAGRSFDAGLRWDDEAGKVAFWFPDRDAAPSPSPKPAASAAPGVGDRCPRCGEGEIIAGRTALGCSRWRAGCEYRAPLPGADAPAAGPADDAAGIPSPSPRPRAAPPGEGRP
ncbi:MAG: topoisomerase C-terminal repeat-containing protein [Myxococcota bacterium]